RRTAEAVSLTLAGVPDHLRPPGRCAGWSIRPAVFSTSSTALAASGTGLVPPGKNLVTDPLVKLRTPPDRPDLLRPAHLFHDVVGLEHGKEQAPSDLLV